MREVRIGRRLVGRKEPVYIIAEAGVNHNGDLKIALEMVKVAADAGADAIKFQTFVAENLAAQSAPMARYQEVNVSETGSQVSMLKKLQLNFADHVKLIACCQGEGIQFLSTPFDYESLALLERLGVEAYKISSGDLTNHPFLREVASMGKPVVLSTGMAELQEVREAVDIFRSCPAVLLHCTSQYPAPYNDVNLRAMTTLQREFALDAGLSDHTPGNHIAFAAVAMGAVMIEKHFTLDKSMKGPDHCASLNPVELKQLVRCIRDIEIAMGDGVKAPTPGEKDTSTVARKSVVAARDIPAGAVITLDALTEKRPGTGIKPKDKEKVVGTSARVFIPRDTLIQWEMVE